jgi:hypothetical protein
MVLAVVGIVYTTLSPHHTQPALNILRHYNPNNPQSIAIYRYILIYIALFNVGQCGLCDYLGRGGEGARLAQSNVYTHKILWTIFNICNTFLTEGGWYA